jgi:DNA (cytosine-5)-methyltransferase 1
MVGVDLFAGAGGMSLGAVAAGIRVVLAVEADVHAARTYAWNHPGTRVFNNDIRRLTPAHLGRIRARKERTIVFGGPPCRGFSYSNQRTRSPDNPDNWLFLEFIRIVRLLRPDWVVFENVRGIVDTANGVFLSQVLDGFRRLRYTVSFGILNAVDFGVAQDRARFFLIGSRDGVVPRMPCPSRHKAVTVAEAIGDLPRLLNGAGVSWLPYRHDHPSRYGAELRGGQERCANHLVSQNAPHIVKRFRHVSQGGNWQDIPARMMRNYRDRSRCHTGIYRRLRFDAPSVVIGNYRKNMLIHPTQDRGLSVREAARIQSFPDQYQFHGSIGFQQQQVGNAVPPLLARAVFHSVVSGSGRGG